MPRHPSDTPQDTRQRLVEAAVVLFAQRGYEGTGIREIAQKAQANSALVQYHFGGKEGLYLASLQHLFEQGPNAVLNLPTPPPPGAPPAQARAAFRQYIRTFLEDLFACHEAQDCSPEMHAAVHLFWTREMLDPSPSRSGLLLQHIRPHVDHLDGCLRALRPDLEDESRFLMGCSIHAQIMFFHREQAIIALLKGQPYNAGDVARLAEHIAEFSLRGLGLPEEGA